MKKGEKMKSFENSCFVDFLFLCQNKNFNERNVFMKKKVFGGVALPHLLHF